MPKRLNNLQIIHDFVFNLGTHDEPCESLAPGLPCAKHLDTFRLKQNAALVALRAVGDGLRIPEDHRD